MYEYHIENTVWITVNDLELDGKDNTIKVPVSFPLRSIRMLRNDTFNGKPCCTILLSKDGVADRIDSDTTREELMKIITMCIEGKK